MMNEIKEKSMKKIPAQDSPRAHNKGVKDSFTYYKKFMEMDAEKKLILSANENDK